MSASHPARTPEALHALLEDAFGRGDTDACLDAYDEDAVVVVPPEGRVARGHAQIRAAMQPIVALAPRLTSVVVKKIETDGLALTHARWQLDGIAADGSRLEMRGRGTIVSRRRPDGNWAIVLDDPLSPA